MAHGDESCFMQCGPRPSASVLRVSGKIGVKDLKDTLNKMSLTPSLETVNIHEYYSAFMIEIS